MNPLTFVPNEVFDDIIDQLVITIGIYKSVGLRYVCRGSSLITTCVLASPAFKLTDMAF